ncbi:MAG: EAL domain-containing protein [Hyphomicrobiaceae bacterium]
MRIVTCLVDQHNLWLVAVAAVVCALGSWTSMRLYAQILRRRESSPAWIFLSAVTVGATVWCTHFVAMLAYEPGMPVAYEPGLTGLSLLIAIATAAIGLKIGTWRSRYSALLGGALLGLGIALMHYSGMAAVSLGALIEWHWTYVVASIIAAVLLGALALSLSVSHETSANGFEAVAAFMAGIVILHFTAMAAMEITPLSPVGNEFTLDAPRQFLAFAVAGVGLLVVGTGVASYVLDRQLRDQAELRQRDILETSVDCILIVKDHRVIAANTPFETLVGLSREEVLGREVDHWFTELPGSRSTELVSTTLRTSEGTDVPVEVAVHRENRQSSGAEVVYYSIRDLRSRLAQEQKIISLARNDSLTGLANRHWFREHLKSALARGKGKSSLALLFLDLDRFKQINDTLGHQLGDALLRTVAERIKNAVRHDDIVARLGGDEFAILLCGSEKTDTVEAVAERLIDEISQLFDLDGHRASIGTSIGIALSPQHGIDPDELLKRADIAMYHAKSSGRGQFSMFETGMDEKLRARLALEADLRNGLTHNQFELFYQPQVDARSDSIVCFEALLRWRHPTRGLVAPMDFIPLAEEIGLMGEIGSWVIRQACADASGWPEHICVAVNVSATQFDHDNLEHDVRNALSESGLSPARLEIEITESLLLTDSEKVIKILRNLRTLGIRIAMDDFGTGYSSLGYLSRFPMDKVKIDRSFIQNSKDQSSQAVIRAVIGLSTSLGMTSTAEGVETLDQLKLLQAEGCTHLQGFYFSKPIEARAVKTLIRTIAESNRIVA